MDTPESVNLPFWEEEDTKVLDLSTGEIYDLLARFAPTVFATNRAWWNSNLPMENWMPQFMPTVEEMSVNDLYKLFAQRFVQRNTTHDVPLRKGVEVVQGLMVYVGDTYVGIFAKDPTTQKWEFKEEHPDIGNVHDSVQWIDENSFVRISGYRYFNGAKYV